MTNASAPSKNLDWWWYVQIVVAALSIAFLLPWVFPGKITFHGTNLLVVVTCGVIFTVIRLFVGQLLLGPLASKLFKISFRSILMLPFSLASLWISALSALALLSHLGLLSAAGAALLMPASLVVTIVMTVTALPTWIAQRTFGDGE